MPQIDPLSPDVAAGIAVVGPEGYERLGLTRTSEPESVLAAVESVLLQHRRGEDELDREALQTLGIVVGDVFVRTLGWRWAGLVDANGVPAVVVLDPTSAYGVAPLVWMFDIAAGTGREIALQRIYSDITIGDLPPALPGDALLLS